MGRRGLAGANPAVKGQEVGYTLDRASAYHRADGEANLYVQYNIYF